jgi:hypothetical protein
LNKEEINDMTELIKVAKVTINTSEEAMIFKDKPFIISAGSAGVWRIEAGNFTRHKLIHTGFFNTIRLSPFKIDEDSAQEAIEKAHCLGKK